MDGDIDVLDRLVAPAGAGAALSDQSSLGRCRSFLILIVIRFLGILILGTSTRSNAGLLLILLVLHHISGQLRGNISVHNPLNRDLKAVTPNIETALELRDELALLVLDVEVTHAKADLEGAGVDHGQGDVDVRVIDRQKRTEITSGRTGAWDGAVTGAAATTARAARGSLSRSSSSSLFGAQSGHRAGQVTDVLDKTGGLDSNDGTAHAGEIDILSKDDVTRANAEGTDGGLAVAQGENSALSVDDGLDERLESARVEDLHHLVGHDHIAAACLRRYRGQRDLSEQSGHATQVDGHWRDGGARRASSSDSGLERRVKRAGEDGILATAQVGRQQSVLFSYDLLFSDIADAKQSDGQLAVVDNCVD